MSNVSHVRATSSRGLANALSTALHAAAMSNTKPRRIVAPCEHPVCPWCILGAEHGNVADAREAEKELLLQLWVSPGWNAYGSLMISNAARWCEYVRGAPAVAPLGIDGQQERRSVEVEPTWSLWPSSLPTPSTTSTSKTPPEASKAPSALTCKRKAAAVTGTTELSEELAPRKTPCIQAAGVPGPRELTMDSVGEASVAVPKRTASQVSIWTGEPMMAAVPPPPSRRRLMPPPPPGPRPGESGYWQVWGGAKTKWVTYETPVQVSLSIAWPAGATISVLIEGQEYLINARAGWQKRPDNDNPARKVRWLPQDDNEVW